MLIQESSEISHFSCQDQLRKRLPEHLVNKDLNQRGEVVIVVAVEEDLEAEVAASEEVAEVALLEAGEADSHQEEDVAPDHLAEEDLHPEEVEEADKNARLYL